MKSQDQHLKTQLSGQANQPNQQSNQKKQTRNGRNGKKHHHATQEAAGYRGKKAANAKASNAPVVCKICTQGLQNVEKEFFPCNCKYKICQKCFWHHVNNEQAKCPNCGLLYEVNRVRDYYATKSIQGQLQEETNGKRMRCESPLPATSAPSLLHQIPQSTSQQAIGLAAPNQAGKKGKKSNKTNSKPGTASRQDERKAQQGLLETPNVAQSKTLGKSELMQGCNKKQRNSSEQQRLQQKLSQVRILQRNTLYVIGLSPNVAKEETLRRYEYFSQYGQIQSITINKEKAFQSENQGLCYSAYVNYASDRDASLGILAVDQFVFDGRLLHASYGRTKYCRFFLKGTNCLNHECPYLHKEAHPENILTQDDMNKKALFQQCQQLALKLSNLSKMTEEQSRACLRAHKESMMHSMKLSHTNRIIMPQLEPVFEKKGLFKHCIQPTTEQQAAMLQVPQQQVHPSVQMISPIPTMPQTAQKPSLTQGNRPEGNTPDLTMQKSATYQRGSEGCHSEMQASQYNMMMFGGRGRLQSSGTLGELDFKPQTSQQSRWHQLLPPTQNRRFAHDDHFLTRMPPAFRLTTGTNAEHHQTKMNLTNQNHFALPQQQMRRFGSPHLAKPQVYFNQQQFATSTIGQQHAPSKKDSSTQFPHQSSHNLRDSDKATQQSSSYIAQQKSLHQMSHQAAYQHHQHSLFQQSEAARHDTRARSGSQVAAVTDQFNEAQQVQRRNSHGKFHVHEDQSKGASNSTKEEQKFFTETLRQKLNQALQGNENDQRYTQEGESLSSSIFAGDHHHKHPRLGNKMTMFPKQTLNCSEGVAAGHACSPIRDSILQSRRGSEDYGALGRPRSQHSLIVESVARILDDTALEQRGDRERRMMHMLNEPNFKTGPPSEVHHLMHERETMALNSHYCNEMDNKWHNQFDLNSSNSLPLTNPLASKQALQKSQGDQKMSGGGNQNTFTSPGGPNTSHGGAYHMNSSLYNSPFFLIPTHTSNQQHRSAAFHDNSLRHLNSHTNAFSLGGNSNAFGAAHSGNDTWRLTHNPHPLLPRGPPGATQSSNLSSAGGVFRHTTQSDPDRGAIPPMLSRTTSQPFMIRTEQKIGRGNAATNQGSRGHNNSHLQHQQYAQLTQRNLEILNKKYCPSKDMLYAKIFTDFRPSSPTMRHNHNQGSSFGAGAPQHPISVQHKITPQSLFCFALDGEDSTNEMRQSAKLRNNLKVQKQVSKDDAVGLLSTPERRKESYFFNQGNQGNKIKETSQTPTNKHSMQMWHQYSIGDTLSQNRQNNSGKLPRETPVQAATLDEIEMANNLANEASLGFGDLYSAMHSKSKKSQCGAGTQMSDVDADLQPQRSRSQSYRDKPNTAAATSGRVMHRYSSGGIFQEHRNQLGLERAESQEVSSGQPSPRSDNSSREAAKRELVVAAGKQGTSQGQSVATATTTGGQKSFYQEFMKVQEGFRKSSGLISSSGFGATQVERRRSSYSQGRNSSARTGIQLMEVTKRNSFKRGSHLRRSMIISPLGLLKFKNHQIDEVNEDGATARDEKIEGEDCKSLRMNSADRQSYNLKTLKSVSRSRKASHSPNGRGATTSQGR